MLVSLVIPCHNESDALPALFEDLKRLPATVAPAFPEVVFIDDGSTDDTLERLYAFTERAWFPCRVLGLSPNAGIGNAMREAAALVMGDAVVTYDADRAYPIEDARRLLDAIDSGADVATASPFIAGGAVAGIPKGRALLSSAASFLYRARLFSRRGGIHTFTCGFRAWRATVFRDCLPREDRFAATAEMLLLALRQRRKVVEVASTLRPREAGVSKMRVFRTMRRHARLLVFGPRRAASSSGGARPS